MRICFILEYYYPHIGGVENLFKNLAEGLSARGHQVTVLTQRLKGTPGKETIRGVQVIRVRAVNRYLFTFLSIPKALAATRGYDLIHTTTYNGAFPAWLASQFRGIPAVITVHEVWINKWRNLTDMGRFSAALHNFLEKLIYLIKFNTYIAVSHSTENQLLEAGIERKRVTVIYNGFDHNFFDPDKYDGARVRRKHNLGDRFVCFSWGRPGVSKGHEYLVRSAPHIAARIPNAKILLMLSARETYKKRHLQMVSLIRELNLTEMVSIVDPVPYRELGDYLKAADCIVIPSIVEGFGYSVLEACAIGKPVVASDTTSIPEVIGGKYVLVKPKDPVAIAGGVESVFNGICLSADVKFFSWEKTVKEHEILYQKLLLNKGTIP